MKKLYKYRWIAFIVPFVLGVYGYMLEYGNNLAGAVYSAIRLYGLSIDVPEAELNIYLRIARWLAMLATTTAVFTAIKRLHTLIGIKWKMRDRSCVVVHGDGGRKEIVAAALGDKAIVMNGKLCFDAERHVLAFESDAAAINYVQQHGDALLGDKRKRVYLSSSVLEPSDYAQSGLVITNNAVNSARMYWKEHWISDESVKNIALIGFGHYGQRLLEQALLVNVVKRDTPIAYHVYGTTGEEFCKWHPYTRECVAINSADAQRDSIWFHPSFGEAGITELFSMDRVILCDDAQDENVLLLDRLLAAGLMGEIHIRYPEKLLERIQYRSERQQKLTHVVAFGDDMRLYARSVILHEELVQAAKDTHIAYVRGSEAKNIKKKYKSCERCQNGVCAQCLRAEKTWDDLLPIEKASNIAAADHEAVKRAMLRDRPEAKPEVIDIDLCRVEHERWSRFYYLHNWRYAPVRNDDRHEHPSLRPFDELSADEQKKDWYSYQEILEEGKKKQ